jgi:AMP-binding enzyme
LINACLQTATHFLLARNFRIRLAVRLPQAKCREQRYKTINKKRGFDGIRDRKPAPLPAPNSDFYDRLKDMIVTGGENVYSGEVEAVIYEHPAVREVAVFGVPDPQWGELVMACVVLKTGETLTADDLIAFCRRGLATYKLPRRVEFSETDLPKNSSGKVLKKTLRERFWMHQQRAVS